MTWTPEQWRELAAKFRSVLLTDIVPSSRARTQFFVRLDHYGTVYHYTFDVSNVLERQMEIAARECEKIAAEIA